MDDVLGIALWFSTDRGCSQHRQNTGATRKCRSYIILPLCWLHDTSVRNWFSRPWSGSFTKIGMVKSAEYRASSNATRMDIGGLRCYRDLLVDALMRSVPIEVANVLIENAAKLL